MFGQHMNHALESLIIHVASPRLLSGVAVVMQGPMPTFTRVLEQHENGEQAPRRRVAGLFIVS